MMGLPRLEELNGIPVEKDQISVNEEQRSFVREEPSMEDREDEEDKSNHHSR